MAHHLGQALAEKAWCIHQVYSRSPEPGRSLTRITRAPLVSRLEELDVDADLYILAVSDDAIADIVSSLNIAKKLLVHTSGTVPMDVLKKATENCGVIWPLQSFSHKRGVDLGKTPVCIEASNDTSMNAIADFSGKLFGEVYPASSHQRSLIHLAAVVAGNFTNLMYLISEEILKKAEMPVDILYPIIRETALRVTEQPPGDTQTGPAIRKDLKTIERHLELLNDEPEKKEIYGLLSRFIMNYFEDKKQNLNKS